jgi:hypothetical protein
MRVRSRTNLTLRLLGFATGVLARATNPGKKLTRPGPRASMRGGK